jgi:hypothetical protein
LIKYAQQDAKPQNKNYIGLFFPTVIYTKWHTMVLYGRLALKGIEVRIVLICVLKEQGFRMWT